jgi:hypothetical protein
LPPNKPLRDVSKGKNGGTRAEPMIKMGVKFLCKRAQMFPERSGIFENFGRTPGREIWQNTAIF